MKDSNVYEPPKSDLGQSNKEELYNLLVVAGRQKHLLFTFLAYFLVTGYSSSADPEIKPFVALLTLVLLLVVVILTGRLAVRLYSKVGTTVMILFSIIPLINIAVILIASSKANKLMKSKGFRIGLAGVDTKEIENAIKQVS